MSVRDEKFANHFSIMCTDVQESKDIEASVYAQSSNSDEKIRIGQLPGIGENIQLMGRKSGSYNAPFSPNLLLFKRQLITVVLSSELSSALSKEIVGHKGTCDIRNL